MRFLRHNLKLKMLWAGVLLAVIGVAGFMASRAQALESCAVSFNAVWVLETPQTATWTGTLLVGDDTLLSARYTPDESHYYAAYNVEGMKRLGTAIAACLQTFDTPPQIVSR